MSGWAYICMVYVMAVNAGEAMSALWRDEYDLKGVMCFVLAVAAMICLKLADRAERWRQPARA